MDLEQKPFMGQQQYILAFENGSVADANRWASELKELILDTTDEVEVKQQQDNPYSQDLGMTLSLILGAPAIVAVARALGNWLTKHREAGISIKTSQGEIVATNLTNKDIMKLAEMWLSAQKTKD